MVDRVKILAKVTEEVACDKMLTGEDPHVKEQQSNTMQTDVSSQQEGSKLQQMARHNTSYMKESSLQGIRVKQ